MHKYFFSYDGSILVEVILSIFSIPCDVYTGFVSHHIIIPRRFSFDDVVELIRFLPWSPDKGSVAEGLLISGTFAATCRGF